MLGARQAPCRVLTRRRLLLTPSPSLPSRLRVSYSKKSERIAHKAALQVNVVARINDATRIYQAFSKTITKEEYDACETDAKRQVLLWNMRSEIGPLIPGRSWDKIYAVARRLAEKKYLWGKFTEREVKKKLADPGRMAFNYVDGMPKSLKTEILALAQQDGTASSLPDLNIDMSETATFDPTEPQMMIPDISSEYIGTKRMEEVEQEEAIEEDEEEAEEPDESEELVQYTVPETNSRPAPQELDQELEASKADLEQIAQAPIPDQKKLSDAISSEEEFTFERLEKLKIKEDTPSEGLLTLQKLSKVLVDNDVLPDMKPVFYPNQTSYAVLMEATSLLEQACFQYIKRTTPAVVRWPFFDCPEAQEYKKWVYLIQKISRDHRKTVPLPPKFNELLTYGLMIRNAAAHRLAINAPKLRELLKRSQEFVDILEVPEISEKYERLQEYAKKSQTEMEEALDPVAKEVRASLKKMKGKYNEISKLEVQIRQIKLQISQKLETISKEDGKLEVMIQKAAEIRYEKGQAFNKEDLLNTIDPKPIPIEPEPVEAHNIEIIEERLEEMVMNEETTPSEADSKHLERDDAEGGLVSYSAKTLADIEEAPSEETTESTTPKEGTGESPVATTFEDTSTVEPTTADEKANTVAPMQPASEGSNLSKDPEVEATKKAGSKWYNPLSWF
ncbi:hypothetical protein TWF694_000136 [Orbilia ellipsospora]|uniref:Uncharacterized protein n=1 Tax=Orbilia ellipsospora TaxID=2528407 RepID=A0AAV9XQB2_9PEZI